MSRLRSLLLLGGTVLVMSYISAPAAPTPAPARTSDAEMRAIDEMAPVSENTTQETERLRARLAIVPEKPAPQRDPFSFGTTTKAPKRATAAPEPVVPALSIEVVPPPPLVWPKLVALLTDNGKITAVLGVGDGVEVLKAGESVGGFLVREITATSIEVVHVATSVTTKLTLR